jgi:putative ABC transport system permease protein
VLKLAWRGVRNNVGRYVATLVAILTGVAFFTATGFLSDRVINALEGDADRQYGSVEAAIVVDDDDAQGSNFADDLRIGGDVAEQIAALPEVAAIGGDLTGGVAFLGADGKTTATGAVGRLWIVDDDLNPIDVDEGAGPAASGEIAIDRGLADDESLAVGDSVTVLTLAGPQDATVVGITSFGNTDAQDQRGTVSISEADAFDWLNSGQVEYQDLFLRGTVGEQELVDAVAPLVPDGFKIQTGEDFLEDKRNEVGAFGQVLKNALQFFALLALFVGGFVIYNTFNVIVAQRLRELAVLAAIGATPKQLKRSLRFEGLVIGLIGSVLGVIAGFALAFGLMALVSAIGVSLPGSGIVINPQVVIQGIVLGTLITLVSVMIPARRAARTEPIEALRDAAVSSTKLTKRRIVVAAILVGLGVFGMLAGSNAAIIGFCGFLLFIGVIAAGPVIAVIGSKILKPVARLLGLEGQLAVANTARNPQRTATTANALLIGVFLVTLVTVAGTNVKDFAVAQINDLSSADYIIQSDGGTVDDQLVADLEAIDDVEAVVPFRRESVSLQIGDTDATPSALSTGDFAAMSEAANLELVSGSIDDLGDGEVLVVEPEGTAPAIGSTVTLSNSAGESVDLQVAGVLKGSLDTYLTGNFVDEATFNGFVGDTAATVAFINVASGAQSDVEDEIETITDLRPDITLTEGNAIGRLVGSIFDFMINAVNGLLLMSVIVALIGIVNTLSLSVIERRRELGLLRVVGMVDKRVQRMVRLESVVISSLGTVSGMLLGIFSGVAMILAIDRLSDANISITLPWLQLAVVLVAGILLGLLAAWIPARRSTRLEVLESIQAT